jgi:hypothetical protein
MRTPRLANTYRDISLRQWCAQIWKATRFEFTINLKTAKAFVLPGLSARADKVVE